MEEGIETKNPRDLSKNLQKKNIKAGRIDLVQKNKVKL
jgi:hypothetical protein